MGKTVTYECDGCKAAVNEADRIKRTTRLEGADVDSYKIEDLCGKCAEKAAKSGFKPTKHREPKPETAEAATSEVVKEAATG